MIKRINYQSDRRHIGLYTSHIHVYHVGVNGRQKIEDISSSLFSEISKLFLIILILEILFFELIIDNTSDLENILYGVTLVMTFVLSIVYYLKKLRKMINSVVLADPTYIALDYNLCISQNHDKDHPETNCVNQGDPIVEIGMFWPDKKFMEEEGNQLFDTFDHTGYHPEYLRHAMADDTPVPPERGVGIAVGISRARNLYPLGDFPKNPYFVFIDNKFRSYEILRNQYNLELSRYDYVCDLGYIITLPFDGLHIKAVIIRRKNTSIEIFNFYRGWIRLDMRQRLWSKLKAEEYIEEQLEKYGKK